MSVIQKIRDKYARWAVIAIAVSLLGFIMMDAFNGRTGLFGNGQNTTIGKINGIAIDRIEFDKTVQQFVQQYGEDSRAQIIKGVWDQNVTNVLVKDQAEKLGIEVTDKEMKDVLYGNNPPQWLSKAFTDQQTGKYDAITAQQQVNQILKKGPSAQGYDFVQSNMEQTRSQLLTSKYMNLLLNSIYFSKWFLEKKNIDNSLAAKVSFVEVPYATIADSAVKISDDEIKNYLNQHEDQYKRDQETRSIQYVLFSTAPSVADSAAAKKEIEKLKPEFAASKDAGAFVAQQNTSLPFDSTYHAKSTIQVPAKDSIFNTAIGGVYGPYLDVNNYVLAKVMDVKNLPDSVKVRHILIGTVNPQTGQPTTPDSIAKAKADSIAKAIQNGASFDLLDSLYSTDLTAKQQKGVMTFSSAEIQGPNFAKPFGQFILFDGKEGDKKVVKTQFGYHYIEILKDIKIEPHYKIAYLAKTIVTSQETDDAARNAATMFAGDSRDANAFNQNFDKNLKGKGYNKQVAAEIDPMEFNLMGVQGSARSFIKKVFDAGKGDVIGPEQVPDNYVVGVVTEINKPGLPNVASVRQMIEPVLKNKKKADIIIKNIGQVASLEQVSAKVNQQITTEDSLRLSGGRTLGYEPKILGAVFNPANKGKAATQPIAGTSGVFVIRVDNSYTVPVATANIAEQRKAFEQQVKQSIMSQFQQNANPVVDPLKKAATIQDNRAKFY